MLNDQALRIASKSIGTQFGHSEIGSIASIIARSVGGTNLRRRCQQSRPGREVTKRNSRGGSITMLCMD